MGSPVQESHLLLSHGSLPFVGGVEGHGGRGEVGAANEGESVLCAPFPIHAGVLPFDRERSLIADAVQSSEELFEIHVAVAGRDEIPAAGRFAEVKVTAENRPASVKTLARVLHVYVVDVVGEL